MERADMIEPERVLLGVDTFVEVYSIRFDDSPIVSRRSQNKDTWTELPVIE